jgi:hypothetical protein
VTMEPFGGIVNWNVESTMMLESLQNHIHSTLQWGTCEETTMTWKIQHCCDVFLVRSCPISCFHRMMFPISETSFRLLAPVAVLDPPEFLWWVSLVQQGVACKRRDHKSFGAWWIFGTWKECKIWDAICGCTSILLIEWFVIWFCRRQEGCV